MAGKDDQFTRILQVRGFGDSLYIPLGKFFKRIEVEKDQHVKVGIRGKTEIVITKTKIT